MREIKFRVWIEETKELFYFDFFGIDGGIIFPESGAVSLGDGDIEKTIMQYTGMKDKNGKDIYEGDIIKTVIIDEFQHQSLLLFEVKYKRGQFILCNSKKEIHLWYYTDEPIIGNIYENPELVERLEE